MKRTRFRTWVALCALSAAVFACSRDANAQERGRESDKPAEAAGHLRRGVALFEKADYAGALVELQRAFAMLPSAGVTLQLRVSANPPKGDALCIELNLERPPEPPPRSRLDVRSIDPTSPYGQAPRDGSDIQTPARKIDPLNPYGS